MRKINKTIVSGVAIAGIGGLCYAWLNCRKVKIPDFVEVVENFDPQQYMGKWYEMARLDFKYEKNLSQVTATYFLSKNGKIEFHNRGYDAKEEKWKEAHGKATFNGEEGRGALKVSFFGPFYSGYNIVMMDPAYETALVFGESHEYMWILSRKKSIPENIKQNYLRYAEEKGYDVSQLTWTKQD
ncbi:lipocalin family protein [Empedobacter stercoris]|uniref:lipocalin family protein n=1 Tax=Empedobacter stercoris TaxID=1628248 RepID=UPI0021AF2E31|nr:lipocalin family protein [Empedobacter stercoris]UWX67190.1 lipocalin family protein [Empedobacter stercoris]